MRPALFPAVALAYICQRRVTRRAAFMSAYREGVAKSRRVFSVGETQVQCGPRWCLPDVAVCALADRLARASPTSEGCVGQNNEPKHFACFQI